jgi:three-Cys-motif partner protein
LIRQKEATFCLLDPRSFQCHWETVVALSQYKKDGENKFELFYFLPNSWMDRALAGLKTNKNRVLNAWWNENWETFFHLKHRKRADKLVDRFKNELGYKFVYAWPILKNSNKGRVMYYMIHASDHEEAPNLMRRAYKRTVRFKNPEEEKETQGSLFD